MRKVEEKTLAMCTKLKHKREKYEGEKENRRKGRGALKKHGIFVQREEMGIS